MEINARRINMFLIILIQKDLCPNLKFLFKQGIIIEIDSVYKKLKYELFSELT